jgi:DNA/RNA endonuclease YhcR with UshA esterase domain
MSRCAEICLVIALALFAGCNKPGPAQSAAQITPEQAKNHLGERVTVSGVVAQVTVSRKGNTFLNFGAAYPNDVFSVTVFASDSGRFPDLRGLTGKRVAVTGLIKLYRGKPEIVLSSPSDLQR